MDNYITKPIKLEEVKELVRQNFPWDQERKNLTVDEGIVVT